MLIVELILATSEAQLGFSLSFLDAFRICFLDSLNAVTLMIKPSFGVFSTCYRNGKWGSFALPFS